MALAAGEALGAGFKVIQRAPAAFAVWLAVDLGLSMILQVVLGATGAAMSVPALLPLLLVVSLLISALVMGAVFRAVLTPDDSRSFYLRLGAQEAWLAAALVAVSVLWIAGVIVLMIPISVLLTLLAGAGGVAMTFLLLVLVYLSLFAVSAWLFLRLSLMLPIAFAEQRIGVMDAWKLSRGQVWNLFGIWLVFFVLLVLVYAIVVGLMFGSALGSIPLSQLGSALEEDPTALSRGMNPVVGLLAGLGLVVAFGVLRVGFAGAWADVYRQLRAQPKTEVFA